MSEPAKVFEDRGQWRVEWFDGMASAKWRSSPDPTRGRKPYGSRSSGTGILSNLNLFPSKLRLGLKGFGELFVLFGLFE